MATQNVKILIRRGLREQLTSDILDTGEFGFTTDTNQLFVGIDPAINEIQFDPFINAHAIIQSWLESDDCPFPGLTVDEDLVIRNIPTSYEPDGTPVSGVQALLDAMHFFTQEINLVNDFNVDPGDTIYQRKFTYADDEADINSLTPGKTYQIREIQPDANDFFNNASGTINRTFSKYDNFTVRVDYDIVENPHQHNGSRVIQVLDTEDITHGVVSYTEPYDPNNNRKKIIVRVREGYPEFTLDNPYVDNYYHFNGDENGNLKSDFGLFKYENTVDYNNIQMRVWRLDGNGGNEWVLLEPEIISDTPGTGNVSEVVNGYAYPIASYGNNYDYVIVTSGPTLAFYQKVAGVWSLISSRNIVTGELNISETEPSNPELGDFWVILAYENRWVKQAVSIVDEANYPDSIETVDYHGVELDKPLQALYSDTDIEDHVVVTKSSKVTYWMRDVDLLDWVVIGSEKYETGEVTLTPDSSIHTISTNVVQAYNDKPGGYWKVILTRSGATEELVEGTGYTIWLNDPALSEGQIIIPPEIDTTVDLDSVEIRYYYQDDFQFSVKPPVEYTNQDGTYVPPATRSNGDDTIVGDYYVYTDKDIFGGTNLNIFQWSSPDFMHQHNTVPVFYSDTEATENSTDGVLLYALPFSFENESVGILELRKRDYDTSTMWYPYEYDDILSYYFTLNPVSKVSEPDLTYAHSISGRSEFSVGYLGRARRNVEVITENSFNQLFADQHLSAQDAYTGIRPSLFRKVFEDTDGVFLRYNKNINSTFFVDYSLKQVTETKTFLRVGQLKIINGYPHSIPEIKLTDENTEIWHDNLVTGDNDTIEDLDEFSNIVFEAAIGEDAYGNETNDLLIIYRQNENCTTEVSYTIKRWTM